MLRRQRKPPKAYSPQGVEKKNRPTVSPIRKRTSIALKDVANAIRYAQTLIDLIYLYEDHKVGANSLTTIERSERIEIANKLKEIHEYLDTLSAKVS